jgi:hypothetical protein
VTWGDISVFNRFGAEGSFFNTTSNRWQLTVSALEPEGGTITNTRLNLTVGYNPKPFQTIAIANLVFLVAPALIYIRTVTGTYGIGCPVPALDSC